MTRTKTFSAIAAALLIAFFSIYAADVTTFTTQNGTQNSVDVTLNMLSGAHQSFTLQPGQMIPSNLNGDAVVGMTVYGVYVVGGVNTMLPSPYGGNVTVSWTVTKNGDGSTTNAGGAIDPIMVG